MIFLWHVLRGTRLLEPGGVENEKTFSKAVFKSLKVSSIVNGAQDVIYFVLKYMFDINSSFQFTIII